MAMCPPAAAINKGVEPTLELASTATPVFARNRRHLATAPFRDRRKLDSEEALITNVQPSPECETGQWIKGPIETNGNYTVLNSRNGFSKTYQAK